MPEKAGQAAQAILAGGIIGAGVQVKDHANMLPTLDLVASYIKPVVKPVVNGVEFVGSSAVAGTTYAWNSAMNAIGYGAVKAVQSPLEQSVAAKAPAASKGIFW